MEPEDVLACFWGRTEKTVKKNGGGAKRPIHKDKEDQRDAK